MNDVGDVDPREFRAAMHAAADRVADFLEGVGDLPVFPATRPGDVARALPASAPTEGERLEAILADVDRLVVPNLTHWNHPGFLAYIANTGSGPGVLGETLTAAFNVNAMLWRTSPAATELEERVCDWVRQWMGLPADFRGHLNDTASTGTLLALAAARDRAVPDARERGVDGRRLAVYTSDQAHSSVEKAAIALGLGIDGVRRVASDDGFRLDPGALAAAIDRDRDGGRLPIAIVATAGTTSTGAIDPIDAVGQIAARHGLWYHVDAAYGGGAMIVPEVHDAVRGLEAADSVVINPHKWLFTPMDCSILLLREPERLKAAFSLVPAYLATTDQGVTNLMDYGFQLGRRFRALKLWMVLRAFGADGVRARIEAHLAMAREFAAWVDADPGFERVAPVTLGIVAFRARSGRDAAADDRLTDAVVGGVVARGRVFLSSSQLRGRPVLRVVVGNLRTTRVHLQAAWDDIRDVAGALR